MTDAGPTAGAGSLVCPFVALAEDRDRRADAPDEDNRCYAEKAPRRRDLAYQAEYCYTTRFGACSVFLAWAARNAAEPARVTPPSAAGQPGAGGTGAADDVPDTWLTGQARSPMPAPPPVPRPGPWDQGDEGAEGGFVPRMPGPSVEGGLFGPPDPAASSERPSPEVLDWVSASAWADAPWDPDAEADVEDTDEPDDWAEAEQVELEDVVPESEEALQGPKVPAALPMRRRRPPSEPIRARGSGEWLYADPLAREPLARRGGGVGPPVMLAVLGLLVVSLVVFLLPSLLGGQGEGDQTAVLASPSPRSGVRLLPTRAPERSLDPSPSPSPTPEPEIRVYVVKQGDTLSRIASRTKVNMRLLQCINALVDPDVLSLGQELLIPPDGYSCPAGWRRGGAQASPEVEPGAIASPAAEPSPEASPVA